MKKDPDHPIIAQPWRYSVVGFNYQRDDNGSSYIDLTLKRDNVVRRLRFTNPQDIQLESGFPACEGMEFLDVPGRNLDRLRIWVTDFEASHGTMKFWAQDVVDLDDNG